MVSTRNGQELSKVELRQSGSGHELFKRDLDLLDSQDGFCDMQNGFRLCVEKKKKILIECALW